MVDYLKMSTTEKAEEFKSVKAKYEELLLAGLSLDMSRGKPNFNNMDLCDSALTAVTRESGFKDMSGVDCRNYGGMDGIPELKKLFGEIFGVADEQVIIGGNASLNMMFDATFSFLCRHFLFRLLLAPFLPFC